MTDSDALNDSSTGSQPTLGWFAIALIVCSLSAITARLIDGTPLRSANDRSRWCTVWSLVERGTYQIDEIRQQSGWDTIDLVRHNDHFYSTKPPLMPRLVAEVYRLVKLSTGYDLLKDTAEATWLVLFIVNIIPAGIAMWMLCSLIRRYCDDTFSQAFLISATCLGTLFLPFLTVLNNHTMSIVFFVYAIGLAVSIAVEHKHAYWRFALCGLFAAFAVCNELPSAPLGLILFGVLLRASFVRTATCFVPAALIPLVGFFVTNYHATGSWKPFYMFYGTEKYLFVYEGVPSYWMNPQGIDQAIDSTATYFFHCTVGHHGILSLSPIFVITLLSWLAPWLWWKSPLRWVHASGILLTAIVLGFYLTKTENYNYGGVSVALRWTLWLTPFWLLAMIPLLNKIGRWWLVRIPCLLFLGVSVFSAWYPANSPWTQPWLYRVMEQQKWIDYSVPRPEFPFKRATWIGAFAEGDQDPEYWMTMHSVAEGRVVEFTLRDQGGTADEREFAIESPFGQYNLGEMTADLNKFRRGFPPHQFVSHDGMPVEDQRTLTFLQGVPKPRLYSSSRIRYVKTDLRTDAFKCHVGYTYADAEVDGVPLRVIRDVWYCEEVPFGVLQFEERIQNKNNGQTVSRSFWRVSDCGKFLPRETPE